MLISEQLELFKFKASILSNTYLVKSGFSPAISFHIERLKGLSISSIEPDDELFRSLLTTLRQFISKDEPIFINKIYNVCFEFLTSDKFKGLLIDARKQWKESQKSSGMTFIFNDKTITPEFVTDLWINGFYFHSDIDKHKKLLSYAPMESIICKNIFHGFITDAISQVLYVGNIITISLKDDLFKKSIYTTTTK